MPEIGTTLREARMRAKIDITEVEQATKIRAKYLRALENEEWSLLPGSTFVKSFLREYAEYLGLDWRTLVEEYKLRYEVPSETELRPISPNLGHDRERRGRGVRRRPVPPWVIGGIVIVALLLALWAVGSLGGGGGGNGGSTSASTTRQPAKKPANGRAGSRPHASTPAVVPAQASVRIVPKGRLYVCLVDQAGKVMIPGTVFPANQPIPIKRAKAMRLTLGNNQVTLRVNGRAVTVPDSSSAIGFSLTTKGAKQLPAGQAPTCA